MSFSILSLVPCYAECMTTYIEMPVSDPFWPRFVLLSVASIALGSYPVLYALENIRRISTELFFILILFAFPFCSLMIFIFLDYVFR